MPELLAGLLLDLSRRCTHLRDRLIGLDDDPAYNDLAVSAFQTVTAVAREVDQLLADPTVGDPAFVTDHLRQFRRWAERVILTESYAVPALERFHADDHRLTALVGRLIAGASVPLPAPVVVASSTQYYWTLPYFALISVPAGEAGSLLGLPDLGHELGHLLLVTHRDTLLADAEREITDDFASAIHDATSHAAPHIGGLAVAATQWRNEWLTEFACDVIATYLFGVAFALQHIRLCALFGDPLWSPGLGQEAAHPADEARLAVAAASLRNLGVDEDAELAEETWAAFAAATNDSKPPAYDLCYPRALLSRVAEHVVAGCQRLGMRPLDLGSADVAAVIAEAWQRFNADPVAYGAWEGHALKNL
jgi:hypothetical protein